MAGLRRAVVLTVGSAQMAAATQAGVFWRKNSVELRIKLGRPND